MKATTLLFSLILTLLLAPNALAIAPGVPQSVVLLNERVLGQDPIGTYQFFTNITFRVSPEDSQSSPAFDYRYWLNSSAAANGWVRSGPLIYSPVPGRIGWAYVVVDGNMPRTEYDSEGTAINKYDITLNLTANDTLMSPPSCLASLPDARVNRSMAQCNVTGYQGPANLTVRTTQAATASGNPILVRLRHATAPRYDQNNTTYLYEFRSTTTENWVNATPLSNPMNGTYQEAVFDFFTAPAGTLQLSWRVRARDNLTHEVSEYSCIATANVGAVGVPPRGCGSLVGVDFGAGNVTFPLIDVPFTASEMGVSEVVLGGFLGLLFTLTVALLAARLGGIIGGIVAAVGSIAFLYVLNIVPFWALVVFFFGGVSVVVLSFQGGNAS